MKQLIYLLALIWIALMVTTANNIDRVKKLVPALKKQAIEFLFDLDELDEKM